MTKAAENMHRERPSRKPGLVEKSEYPAREQVAQYRSNKPPVPTKKIAFMSIYRH